MATVVEDLKRMPFVVASKDGAILKVVFPHPVQMGISGQADDAMFAVRQGLALSTRPLATTGPVNVKNSETFIPIAADAARYDAASNRFRIVFPVAKEIGELHIVTDEGATAGAVQPIITAANGATFDGDSSVTLTENNDSVGYMWSGRCWVAVFRNGSGGGGGGSAPATATYVTLTTDATLTQERTLAVSSDLSLTDGGAGGAATIGLSTTGVVAGSYTNTSITVDSRGRVTSISNGAGGGGDPGATYLVLSNTASLSNERAFAAGIGLLATDGGAGSSYTLGINNNIVATVSGTRFTGATIHAGGLTGSLTKLADGSSLIAAGTNVTVVTSSTGQIIISSTDTQGADPLVPYLVVAGSASLPNERTFAVGTGLLGTDGGANNFYSVAINNNVVATVSGTRFTGDITVASGQKMHGRHEFLADGTTPYIKAARSDGSGVKITTGSDGQILIGWESKNVAADVSASYIVIGSTGSLPNERSLAAGPGIVITDNGAGGTLVISTDVSGSTADPYAAYLVLATTSSLQNERVLVVSGTSGLTLFDSGSNSSAHLSINNNIVATISGSTFTGATKHNAGLSGSLTQLVDGRSYLVAGPNITITSASNGQVIISGSAGGGGGGDLFSTFLTLSTSSFQDNERVLTVSGTSGLRLTDAGPGMAASLAIDNNVVATVSGTTFTGATIHSAGLSGSLTKLPDGRSYIVGGSNVLITSASNGQVIIAAQLEADNTDATARLALPLLAGVRSTGYTSAAKQIIGSYRFDPDYVNAGDVYFRALLETSDASYPAAVDLYDLDGIVAWPPGQVISSVLSASSLISTLRSVNLSTVLNVVTGAGTFEARLWLDVSGSGVQATCNGAWLDVPAAALTSSHVTQSIVAGDISATYLVLSATASLLNERVFSPGTGLLGADGGSGGSYTLSINNNIVATISGSTFTGVTKHNAGLSGSLTQLTDGRSYLVAGNNVTIASQSNGQVVVSSTSAGGADPGASYLVVGVTASLANERQIAAGTGLTSTDGGAGGNFTLGINNNVVATVSGTTFTGLVKANGGVSGTVTATGVGDGAVVFGTTGGVLTGSIDALHWNPSTRMLGIGKVAQFLSSSQYGQRASVDISGSISLSFSRDNEKNSIVATTFGVVPAGVFEFERQSSWGSYNRLWLARPGGGAGTQNAYKAGVFDDPLGYPNQNTHLTINYPNEVGSPYTGLVNSAVVYIGAGSSSIGGVDTNIRPSLWAVNDTWLATIRGNVGIGTTTPQDKFSVVGSTSFTGSVAPGVTNTYDFGTTSKAWRNIYARGFSGSHTTLTDGSSYLVAGNNVTITTASNGQVFIAATGGGGSGGGADPGATYLVVSATGSLANERAIAAGTGLTSTDGGAGNSFTLGINNNVVATVSGTTFTGTVSGTLIQAPLMMTTRASTSASYVKSFAVGETGRIAIHRDIDAGASKTFTVNAGNGATLFDLWLVMNESAFSIAKKYTVCTLYAGVVTWNKIVDTGPYGAYDLNVSFVKTSANLLTVTLSHNYPGTRNVAITYDMPASSIGGGAVVVTFNP